MVEYEDDFINEELIEFDVDGKKFKYKPTTAEDELSWAPEYIDIVDGKPQQNIKKVTLCKFRNLKEVPYSKELIKKIINVEKDWKNLSNKEKSDFIGKLNPRTFDKIIRHINKIDSPSEQQKKT
ncbi:hypothetical protein KAR91_07015 [Candidatus Pacearchaeota archaeon]|nr:hypothetical protein [Candidatus Pacearchaeota archaeon]